ncbi:hypothetical protein [Fodinibius saliphilus]|uniref:hypothetical protein n=1 Tax=Fodinibius saliphilus TaxID=1920650 RepID=UPI001107CA45|nr:hypothetical protein [Fodinibius saliphilus]
MKYFISVSDHQNARLLPAGAVPQFVVLIFYESFGSSQKAEKKKGLFVLLLFFSDEKSNRQRILYPASAFGWDNSNGPSH